MKDEAGPLDVTTVEGLCRKLRDMPSLSTRAIVSSSGFTAPARRKATTHAVTCLTFQRGPLPPSLSSFNISQLNAITINNPEWLDGPHVVFCPEIDVSEEERALLRKEWQAPPQPAEEKNRFARAADQAIVAAQQAWNDPTQLGPARVDIRVNGLTPIALELPSRTLRIETAQVKGVLRWCSEVIPINECCYLAEENGRPFAATLLVEALEGLLAIGVAAGGNSLFFYHVPDVARTRRPLNFSIARTRPA